MLARFLPNFSQVELLNFLKNAVSKEKPVPKWGQTVPNVQLCQVNNVQKNENIGKTLGKNLTRAYGKVPEQNKTTPHDASQKENINNENVENKVQKLLEPQKIQEYIFRKYFFALPEKNVEEFIKTNRGSLSCVPKENERIFNSDENIYLGCKSVQQRTISPSTDLKIHYIKQYGILEELVNKIINDIRLKTTENVPNKSFITQGKILTLFQISTTKLSQNRERISKNLENDLKNFNVIERFTDKRFLKKTTNAFDIFMKTHSKCVQVLCSGVSFPRVDSRITFSTSCNDSHHENKCKSDRKKSSKKVRSNACLDQRKGKRIHPERDLLEILNPKKKKVVTCRHKTKKKLPLSCSCPEKKAKEDKCEPKKDQHQSEKDKCKPKKDICEPKKDKCEHKEDKCEHKEDKCEPEKDKCKTTKEKHKSKKDKCKPKKDKCKTESEKSESKKYDCIPPKEIIKCPPRRTKEDDVLETCILKRRKIKSCPHSSKKKVAKNDQCKSKKDKCKPERDKCKPEKHKCKPEKVKCKPEKQTCKPEKDKCEPEKDKCKLEKHKEKPQEKECAPKQEKLTCPEKSDIYKCTGTKGKNCCDKHSETKSTQEFCTNVRKLEIDKDNKDCNKSKGCIGICDDPSSAKAPAFGSSKECAKLCLDDYVPCKKESRKEKCKKAIQNNKCYKKLKQAHDLCLSKTKKKKRKKKKTSLPPVCSWFKKVVAKKPKILTGNDDELDNTVNDFKICEKKNFKKIFNSWKKNVKC